MTNAILSAYGVYMDKKIPEHVSKLIAANSGIKLDIGCGDAKNIGFVGMDYRARPGVDIVHDVEQFPWPLPDESVLVAVSSHLVEHLNPHHGDNRITSLVKLLLDKKIITPEEITEYIGELDPGPRFMRFMDEVWRVLKPDGEFGMVFPYAGSPGYWQDPTHINGINECTWWYFDPEEPHLHGDLYTFYRPKPWRIKMSAYAKGGNMEIVLVKRAMKDEYLTMKPKIIGGQS